MLMPLKKTIVRVTAGREADCVAAGSACKKVV